MLRKIIIVTVVFVILLGFCLISDNSKVISMNTTQVKAEEDKVVLYAVDGRTLEVFSSEVTTYLDLDW